MHFWFAEALPFICVLIALFVGRSVLFGKTKALFPKLVAAALGCIALGCVNDIAYYFIADSNKNGVYIGYLGIIGCFLFLLSASYGQLDRLFDDGSKIYKKSRIIAFTAPLLLVTAFIPIIFTDKLQTEIKVIEFIGWVPIILSSYFNLKHAILPDCGFGFIKAVRKYNVTAVVFEFSQVLYLVMRSLDIQAGIIVGSVILSLSLIALMHFAKKGATEWTI